MAYSVAIAGSTDKTLLCARSLEQDPNFSLTAVITPQPKPVGRTQQLTTNPLHQWANSNQIHTLLIKNKVDSSIQKEIELISQPDFLLVVDFGYLIDEWLLGWPKIAPLNIHPSALPRWRGSSPGQMVLLHGEPTSAVSLIIMTQQLDAGPIVIQLEFEVNQSWTQADYYQHSFELIAPRLPKLLSQFAQGQLTPQPQPTHSPTPTATQLTKKDSFFSWKDVNDRAQATQIERAIRAYNPWPMAWTLIPTNKGEKRMQLLEAKIDKSGHLRLMQVKIEGMAAKPWQEVKNILLEN